MNFPNSLSQKNKIENEYKKALKGAVKFCEPLKNHTAFKIGGAAWIWAEPSDIDGLKRAFIISRKYGLKVFILGGGSNILVSDGPIDGVVIHLGRGRPFSKIEFIAPDSVFVGAGCSLARLHVFLLRKGLGGLEFASGIPGSVAGAVCGNSGIAKSGIGDFVESVDTIDFDGTARHLGKDEIAFGYRSSNIGGCVTGITLRLKKKDPKMIMREMKFYIVKKKKSQDLWAASAGCIFKNPASVAEGAGKIIDSLNLKGLSVGDAAVSKRHANFIINNGRANAQDVLALIDIIRRRVFEKYKINLDLEIKVWPNVPGMAP